MYQRYFGLHENPFALPPDPRFLYLAPRYEEALAHLTYGITQPGGFVQLTGEVGTGKTMMIRALLERLPPEVNVALVLYPLLSVEEFVAAVCDDLGIARLPDGGLKGAIDALNRYLLEQHARGRRTVLVIDEAHKLSHDVLEQVRLLTNLETTKEKLLQILLVGQPELTTLLAQPDLRQLTQRITARYRLAPLRRRESAQYIVQRLATAGAQYSIFTGAALFTLHRLSGGIPRLINTFCDRALLGAYAHGRNRVTAGVVRRAAAEVGYAPVRYGRRLAFAAGVLGAIAVGGWQLSTYVVRPLPVSGDVAVASQAAPEGADPAPAAAERAAPEPSVAALLADSGAALDTETALAALFAQWRKDYARLPGDTGCERALAAGLRCIYDSGTWSNLRQLNRPAVIELLDANGRKHHVLVKGLEPEAVELAIGGEARTFPRAEVERYWYGKYLTLWQPPPSGDLVLRIGMQGPAVAWLRRALARASGEPARDADNLSFDRALERAVREFQRRHRLEPDGIVGRNTLIQLDAYAGADLLPPPLISASAQEAH